MSNSGRWIWDAEENSLVPSSEYYAKQAARRHSEAAFFMADIKPFVSPIDGKEISSRSQLREHEIRHNVRQVGNDLKLPDYDAASVRKRAPQDDRAMSAAFHIALQKAGLS